MQLATAPSRSMHTPPAVRLPPQRTTRRARTECARPPAPHCDSGDAQWPAARRASAAARTPRRASRAAACTPPARLPPSPASTRATRPVRHTRLRHATPRPAPPGRRAALALPRARPIRSRGPSGIPAGPRVRSRHRGPHAHVRVGAPVSIRPSARRRRGQARSRRRRARGRAPTDTASEVRARASAHRDRQRSSHLRSVRRALSSCGRGKLARASAAAPRVRACARPRRSCPLRRGDRRCLHTTPRVPDAGSLPQPQQNAAAQKREAGRSPCTRCPAPGLQARCEAEAEARARSSG